MFAKKFIAFIKDESAPTAAEYAIIITLGLAIIAAGIGAFYAAINGAFERGTSLLGG